MSHFVLPSQACTRVAAGDAPSGTLATETAVDVGSEPPVRVSAHPRNPIHFCSPPLSSSSLPWGSIARRKGIGGGGEERSRRWRGGMDPVEERRNRSGGGEEESIRRWSSTCRASRRRTSSDLLGFLAGGGAGRDPRWMAATECSRPRLRRPHRLICSFRGLRPILPRSSQLSSIFDVSLLQRSRGGDRWVEEERLGGAPSFAGDRGSHLRRHARTGLSPPVAGRETRGLPSSSCLSYSNFYIRSYKIGVTTTSIEKLMNHLQETALSHVKGVEMALVQRHR